MINTVRRQFHRSLLKTILAALVSLGFAVPAFAQLDTSDFFKQRCYGCHTIGGGRLQGPDLKAVSKRKDRDWLIRFMMDPQKVIDSGDKYANDLLKEYRVPMPRIEMSRERAEKLLDLIAEESAREKSRFQGMKLLTRPFTDADRELGRKLFIGKVNFQNGGVSCISCHSMHDMPALGGGRLGPELTRIVEKQGFEDRKKLGTWLAAPGSPAMQPVFDEAHALTADEIQALSAYFYASAKESQSDASVARVSFLFLGLFLAAALVFGMDVIWKRRFHAVRKPLVDSETSHESAS